MENPKRTATPWTVEIFITAVLIQTLSPAHSHNHPTWMHWWYCICFHLSFLLRTLCAGSLFFFLVICPTSHRHTRSRVTDWLSDDLCRSFVARHIYLNSKLTTTQSTCFRIARASFFYCLLVLVGSEKWMDVNECLFLYIPSVSACVSVCVCTLNCIMKMYHNNNKLFLLSFLAISEWSKQIFAVQRK